MTEYIDRDMFLKMISHKPSSPTTDREDRLINCFISAVKNFPAADVRPVVRGKWLTGNDNPRTYGRIRAMCGRCGAFALAEMVNAGSYKERLSNFCPNCGADMREGNDV